MNMKLNLRLRVLILGFASGAGGAALCLTMTTRLGVSLGGTLGIVLSALLGLTATFASILTFEQLVRQHLVASDDDSILSANPPESTGDDEFNELLAAVRHSLRRARQAAADAEEVDRMARTLWIALNPKPGTSGPAPDARHCIAGLFEMFRQTADSLVRYSSILEEANERMSSGATDQSETVSRTTSTVEVLSDKIDRISQNAENATEACERTRLEAKRGMEQVQRVIEGMDRLRAQIEINGRKARRLGERSVEIGTIVELIRGISSRTDMLALNATIESVRAGEHGRGFAVVAEEIRKLSERTAAATRDIGTLVEAIQADTHESIRALGEEQSEMERESQRVRETGEALERISEVAAHSAQLVDGISRSSNDQVLSAQELVRAMQRISEVSHLTLERSAQSRETIRGLVQWCDRLAPLTSLEAFSPNPSASSSKEREDAPSPIAPWRSKRFHGIPAAAGEGTR
jgi:methyl-accepting chemotaxis protein